MFLLLDSELDTPLENGGEPLDGGEHYDETAHDELYERENADEVTEEAIARVVELVDGVGGQNNADEENDG